MQALIMLVAPVMLSVGAERPAFHGEFFNLCDAVVPILDDATRRVPFYQDSYAVRALAVAYDMSGKRQYLDACRRWSARMADHQARMTPQGAYYMNYRRKPGELKGEWYVGDSSSIALAVLATAVRCPDAPEKARLLDSVSAYARLVMEKYDSQWGSKLGGLPFHLYVWSRYLPQGEAIASSADKDLTHIGKALEGDRAKLFQLLAFAMMSYAERLSPGSLYRTDPPKPATKTQASSDVTASQPAPTAAAPGFPIVEDGKPRAALAPLAPNAPEEVRRAVDEFQRVLEKMTGTRLPTQPQGDGPIVHIGRDALVDGAGLELERLDEDGFVIRTLGNRHLILAGRTPHATEFAVYRFLQKYGGVRWYFPTALGEVVPRRASLCVGPLAQREEPSFHSRLWSAAAPFDGGAWEHRNLCRGRYNFHHNLLNIFVPSKFYDSHPQANC